MRVAILNWARQFAKQACAGILLMLTLSAPMAQETNAPQKMDSVQVMEAFERQADKSAADKSPSDQEKRLIMFIIGVPLLILLLTTGALGIAMAVYGKQVFVLHMVFAGLTATLAVVHVIVGLVWFYPF